jgi:hypothetical protein
LTVNTTICVIFSTINVTKITNELSPIPYVCEKNMYALGKNVEGDKLGNFEIDLQFKYYECCSYTTYSDSHLLVV